MRHALPLMVLATLAGCLHLESIEPEPTPPVSFALPEWDLAVGGTVEIPIRIEPGTGLLKVESQQPEQLTVERIRPDAIRVTPHAAGVLGVRAFGPDGATLGSASIRAARVESAELICLSASPFPVAELAAIAGAAERIRILPRGVNGQLLAGADPVLDVRLTNLTELALELAPARVGRPGGFLSSVPGPDLGIRFGEPGVPATEAQIRIAAYGSSTPLLTVPVRLITEPASVSLDLDIGANQAIARGGEFVVGLHGRAWDNLPVAGLTADFQLTPASLVSVLDATATGELVGTAGTTRGVLEVQATLPSGHTATRWYQVQ